MSVPSGPVDVTRNSVYGQYDAVSFQVLGIVVGLGKVCKAEESGYFSLETGVVGTVIVESFSF